MVPQGLIFGLLAALGWRVADFLVAHIGARVGERTVFAIAPPIGAALLLGQLLHRGVPLAPLLSTHLLVVGLLGAVALLALYTALRMGPVAITSPVGRPMAAWPHSSLSLLAVNSLDTSLLEGLSQSRWASSSSRLTHERSSRHFLSENQSGPPSAEPSTPSPDWVPRSISSIQSPVRGPDRCRVRDPSSRVDRWDPVPWGFTLIPRVEDGPLLAVGILDTGAFVAFALGISAEPVAVVTPIASVFALVTVALARVILTERLTAAQWVGVALVIFGTPLLSG